MSRSWQKPKLILNLDGAVIAGRVKAIEALSGMCDDWTEEDWKLFDGCTERRGRKVYLVVGQHQPVSIYAVYSQRILAENNLAKIAYWHWLPIRCLEIVEMEMNNYHELPIELWYVKPDTVE